MRSARCEVHDGKVKRRGHRLEAIDARERESEESLEMVVFTYKKRAVDQGRPCFTQESERRRGIIATMSEMSTRILVGR